MRTFFDYLETRKTLALALVLFPVFLASVYCFFTGTGLELVLVVQLVWLGLIVAIVGIPFAFEKNSPYDTVADGLINALMVLCFSAMLIALAVMLTR